MWLRQTRAWTRFSPRCWSLAPLPTVDSYTLLKSVSGRSRNFVRSSAKDHLFSDSTSSADQSSQFWLYAYTVGLPLSYLDNTSAAAESYAFLCAAPRKTRGHALYSRPQKTECLLLLGSKQKQGAGTFS